MKKVFLLALGLVLGFSAFAQRANVSNDAKNFSVTAQKVSAERISEAPATLPTSAFAMPNSVVKAGPRCQECYEEFDAMITNYDLQSNSAIGNRIATWPDGTAAFVATWDHSQDSGFPDRGTGYNFYDGTGIGELPEGRQEGVKSGWPSITACGEGELLASHATGVNLYYRPTKGEGAWTLVHNWGAADGSPTWPRVVVSGPNNEYIHVVMCKQISVGSEYDNHVYYVRIVRNGDDPTAWEISPLADFPGVDNTNDGEYRNQLSADDYVMAANGNDVACLFNSYTVEVFYMISHDNGENWERQIVAPYPISDGNGGCVHAIDFADYPDGMTDTISTSDNTGSIAIDNNGVVHVAFGLFHWRVTDSDSYTYYPAGYFGIVYWNSNYTNELGGNEILPFGQSAVDANHPDWADNGLGWTLHPDRIEELATLNGQEDNLHLCGYFDENENGQMDYDNVTGATWHYRCLGLATCPGVSVDNMGNVAIIYNLWSESRVSQETSFSYRSPLITYKTNDGNGWQDEAINLMDINYCFDHIYHETYATTSATNGINGKFYFSYNYDEKQGLYLDINDTYPNSNGGEMTENTIAAVVVDLSQHLGLTEAVNPMTSVRAYPNPATDVMTLEINASMASEMTINIYNITGQNVMNKTVNVNTGINNAQINVNELESGVYFCSVNANGFNKTVKVIVK